MEKRQKIFLIALLLSLLIHIGFFWVAKNRNWFLVDLSSAKQSSPQEVVITFPENKPKKAREIVQNKNENNQVPTKSNLLSDKNSRARNPVKNQARGNQPLSKGNSPFANLSPPNSKQSYNALPKPKFSAKALRGTSAKTPTEEYREKQQQAVASASSSGSGQMLQQKQFSVEEVGAISLSTYKWAWAPYVNAMKSKLERVWFPPSAYYQLGLIHGYTVIKYTINRKGEIIGMHVLDHQGHESLRASSTNAIESLFPFLPLPKDFPDETLTITAKLVYPDLRRRR